MRAHARPSRAQPAYGASLPTGVARWMTWRWQQGVAAQLARAPLPPTQARERLSADAAAALAALAARLEAAPAGGPYFFGAEASSLDAFALAHLAFIAHAPTVRHHHIITPRSHHRSAADNCSSKFAPVFDLTCCPPHRDRRLRARCARR